MAEYGHGPNLTESESPDSMRRNSRLGLILFAIYLVLYGGFVLLNAFAPQQMERPVLAGVNLAIVYGFVLIAVAFVLALLYGWLCRGPVVGKLGSSAENKERQP